MDAEEEVTGRKGDCRRGCYEPLAKKEVSWRRNFVVEVCPERRGVVGNGKSRKQFGKRGCHGRRCDLGEVV